MKLKTPLIPSLGAGLLCFGLSACLANSGDDYTPLTLTPEGDRFIAKGVIDSSSPNEIETALSEHPHIKTVELRYVPGSADDEANLRAARMLRAAGMTTIVPSGGLVASGGTDLFLAGTQRMVGPGACLGVHSWASVDGTNMIEGKDVPRNDPQHQLYLSYYDEMGIDQKFYWYTLEAADATGIHYLSTAQINQFGMTTTPVSAGPDATPQSCARIEELFGFS